MDRDLIILLQEVKKWRDRLDERLQILSEIGKDCAIVIPKRLGEAVLDVQHGEFFSLALIGSLATGSIHFPHDRGAQSVWTSTLEAVERKLAAWQHSGLSKAVVLGVDLNFTLPKEIENISGTRCLSEGRNTLSDRMR